MTRAITALPLARTLLLMLAFACARVHGAQAGSWFDGERPGAQAQSAVALLQSAAEIGLEPQDYNTGALVQTMQRLRQAPMVTASERSQLDAALTDAVQRYLSDLSTGRIAPPASGGNYGPTRRSTIDIGALLQAALANDGLAPLSQRLEQQVPMSARLRELLARYRALESDRGWDTALPEPAGGKLDAGQAYAGMPTLVHRLTVLGDLDGDAALPTVVDTRLTAAIARFQQRHGLLVDGVMGRNTLAQLAVTPRQRARQIALTMERMRWTPLLQAPRMIVVNVPEFVLRAYEIRDDRIAVRLTMNIIVGKALDTRTPLFDEDMRFIEFSPNWNVPYSIASKELVPRLRKEPDYFTQQGFEFVTDTGAVVDTLSEAHLGAVMAGTWRIRQRPGPKNALGDVKFIFPNNAAIYLHHTPSPGLFAKPRRDFSHGCVRVEAPVALARFVLQDDPAWTEERIREAMALGKSHTIRLQQAIPVVLAYSTVVIKQGMAFFLPDIYGHDAELERALQDHSRAIRHADLR
ncbi:MAG TPA: L,D-transpeptidase family protein [Burkholderiaceae bacterium]|nr:L,D-transpeptidase family protein [Burkholderiaceae bacterium]